MFLTCSFVVHEVCQHIAMQGPPILTRLRRLDAQHPFQNATAQKHLSFPGWRAWVYGPRDERPEATCSLRDKPSAIASHINNRSRRALETLRMPAARGEMVGSTLRILWPK